VLIERTLAGDNTGFDGLITRYRDRIFSLAFHLLWNRTEAEDLAQEVFLRAYRGLKAFRRDARFFTWLYRITVNLVYTQSHRAASRRHAREQLALALRSAPCPQNPAELVEADEASDLLHAALANLDLRLREVLVLREIEGLEVAEVARMLRIPEGTVKSRLFRAHEDLRRRFSKWSGRPKESNPLV
jgi:RNA polymerase sigma-70 factor (ECF subfamily)